MNVSVKLFISMLSTCFEYASSLVKQPERTEGIRVANFYQIA